MKETIQSRSNCEFKTAFIPKGWTCVNIERCSSDIAKELKRRKK